MSTNVNQIVWGHCGLIILFVVRHPYRLVYCPGDPSAPGHYLNQTAFIVNSTIINSLRPARNYHHFEENIFKCIFLEESFELQITVHITCFSGYDWQACIGWVSGLLPNRRRAITWTNVQWNVIQNEKFLFQGNAFENIICRMAAILWRYHCVIVNNISFHIFNIIK